MGSTKDVVDKTSPIVIVGAGAFGLSSAIHLARRGYQNVTILDRQPYDETLYSYDAGCDAASADYNKVMRAAYGQLTAYQELGLEALDGWRRWNAEVGEGRDLPPGFTPRDRIFVNNGSLELNSDEVLTRYQRDSISGMTAAGLGDTQLDLSDPADVRRAERRGFGFAVNPFGRTPDRNFGLLDTTAGFVYADRACRFALHKARSLGVRTMLGGPAGTFVSLARDVSDHQRVTGVETADGRRVPAKLVIMACGGWTPSLLPEMDNLCETTAGSVSIFRLPPNTPLWDRFAPENFPTWAYDLKKETTGGLYGFPRTPDGIVKIGYRGTKFTNPQTQTDGVVRSVPVTRWTGPDDATIRRVPQIGADAIRRFVRRFLPELDGCPVTTRLCWYTDSFDNHFVVDFVPGTGGTLLVATGGSGHGFHFLPNLGRHVVDRIEGKKGGELLDAWRWRVLDRRRQGPPVNHIMQGFDGPRVLYKQPLTKEDSLDAELAKL